MPSCAACINPLTPLPAPLPAPLPLLAQQLGCAVAVLCITATELQDWAPYSWATGVEGNYCLLTSAVASSSWCYYAMAVAAISILMTLVLALMQVRGS